jgi:hypothetical protein
LEFFNFSLEFFSGVKWERFRILISSSDFLITVSIFDLAELGESWFSFILPDNRIGDIAVGSKR